MSVPQPKRSARGGLGEGAVFLDEAQARACIHCGLCLGACPTYLETGNENNSPRGRIYLMRALQEGRLALQPTPVRHIDLCLGCRACEAVCPSGVQYGHLLEQAREHIENGFRRPFFQRALRRVAIEKVLPYPRRLKWALLSARAIRALSIHGLLPRSAREALALVPRPAASCERLPKVSPARGQMRGRVGFLSGCVMDALFAGTNAATVRLLTRAGYEVVVPSGQGCCGALFAHTGNLESARQCVQRNIEAFERHKIDWIVVNAAGCGSTMKDYGALMSEDPSWAQRARFFSAKVKDLTELLAAEALALFSSSGQLRSGVKVTYHDACHLAHAQRVTQEPRALVKAVAGANYVELPDADLCCGSAGTYNLTEPEMARRLQLLKLENILRTGARVVVTANPGCLLQIQAGCPRVGAQVEVVHIADFLERMTSP